VKLIQQLKAIWTPKPIEQAPKIDRAEAIATAAMVMVEALAEVQIKTIYGLTHAGVAAMFRASADSLTQSAEKAMDAEEQGALYLMAKEIMELADRVEAKQA
jgi:hypothetical protein